ncbi:uncharacterized [Tachysurus ichikawai]
MDFCCVVYVVIKRCEFSGLAAHSVCGSTLSFTPWEVVEEEETAGQGPVGTQSQREDSSPPLGRRQESEGPGLS